MKIKKIVCKKTAGVMPIKVLKKLAKIKERTISKSFKGVINKLGRFLDHNSSKRTSLNLADL